MSSSFLVIALAVSLAAGITAVIMCFALMAEVAKLRSSDRSRLRCEGNALHGRVVLVDDIGWERELVTWGLHADGSSRYDVHSDVAVPTGYMIAGPDDIDIDACERSLDQHLRDRGAVLPDTLPAPKRQHLRAL